MVLEVLESVSFLISSGDCYVVMGMARERVVGCVGLSFKDVASELLAPELTGWRALRDRVLRRPLKESAQKASGNGHALPIPEEALVALAAIDHCHPE